MLGRSLLAYVPVNLANLLASFGTIVILTRLLDAAEFGRYGIAIITMNFAHMLLFTWIEAAMARYQARAERENDEPSHLKTLFLLAFMMSVIAAILYTIILVSIPLETQLKTAISFALATTCLQIFFNLSMEGHKAAHRIKRYSISYSTQSVLGFSLGIILIMTTPLREVGPILGAGLGMTIVLLMDMVFTLPQLKGGTFQKEKAKLYASYGIPISLSLILSYALNSADMYLIKGFMGDASAGEYNAGYNLANRSLDILFIWLAMAVTPVAISAFEKDGEGISQKIMRNYGASLLWITLPAATGIALVAKDAGFILGEDVRDNAVTVMPLIAFAGVMNGFIAYYIQRAFMLSGKTKAFAWIMLPPFIVNIVLNLILIPKFGLMGAVYATVAAYGLGVVLSFGIARRYYPLPLPTKAITEIAFACSIMTLVVILIPWSNSWPSFITLMAKAIIGGSVYLSVCWFTNAAGCQSLIKGLIERFRPSNATPPNMKEVVHD